MIRNETLTWGMMPHWFRIWQDSMGTHGTLAIVKPNGSQVIAVPFPESVTIDEILAAWEQQGFNWVDAFAPLKTDGTFVVIRTIDLGTYTVFWHVYHVHDYPRDACVVLKNPPKPAAT
ncbi:MAG: hypothetical protein PHX87_06565 [Candidatus Peribacteraceae bacterium]|nr:hypothetical protein [Candidatus Peribacteraceae bacterium]MDD5743052.1 hypothetical protein [Candidatus Peribacteraceae bacterium]